MRDIRLIIAGGRKFDDYEKLSKEIDLWKKDHKVKNDDKITIVNGCAEGADSLGKRYGEEHEYDVVDFPANWTIFGKPAGILRNKEMAKYASESVTGDGYLLAFWNGKSKGTENMISTAIQHGISVNIYCYTDDGKNRAAEIVEEYIGKVESIFADGIEKLFSPDNTEDITPESFSAKFDRSLVNDKIEHGQIKIKGDDNKKIEINVKNIDTKDAETQLTVGTF